jgi:hypothetical protein
MEQYQEAEEEICEVLLVQGTIQDAPQGKERNEEKNNL